MADVAIIFRQSSPSAPMIADWEISAGDLLSDPTLATAVYLSLYTDADAPDDVEVPEGMSARKWWGQDYWGRVFAVLGIEASGLQLGSLRWTLVREKQTEQTKSKSIEYDRRALAWMITVGLAKAIDISAEWTAPGELTTTILITKPDGLPEKFQTFWRLAQ